MLLAQTPLTPAGKPETVAPVARQLFWNNLKRKANSRFWSWVFEPEDMKQELDAKDAALDEIERRKAEEPLFVWGETNEKPNA